MKRVLVSTVALLTLAGCSASPPLYPRVIAQGEPVGTEFRLAAPYILVVRISGVDVQPSRFALSGDRSHALRLVEFTAEVENVIKGDLPDHSIHFLFFADPGQNPSYVLRPGERYIVSLRKDGKVLRSWTDVTQLNLRVDSGKHDQQVLPLNLGVGPTIAYILMVPGSGWDHKRYGLSFATAESYATPAYMAELVKQVLANPDRELRTAACLEAAAADWQPGCLSEVLHDPDARTRKAAHEFVDEPDQELPLQTGPLSLLPTRWSEYLHERLQIYTADSRPDVKKAACGDLRVLYPDRAAPACR